jgi:hypothetical protein
MAGFREPMELAGVPGLGPAKAQKLSALGVNTLKDLAELDMRQLPEIGIGREVLRRAKAHARRECDKKGIPYSKANYRSTGQHVGRPKAASIKTAAKPTQASATKANGTTEPTLTKAPEAGASHPRSNEPGKKGLLARLFKRN